MVEIVLNIYYYTKDGPTGPRVYNMVGHRYPYLVMDC